MVPSVASLLHDLVHEGRLLGHDRQAGNLVDELREVLSAQCTIAIQILGFQLLQRDLEGAKEGGSGGGCGT